MDKKFLDALLAERDECVRRGKKDRVQAIDALLNRRDDDVIVETAAMDVAVEQAKVVRGRKRKKA